MSRSLANHDVKPETKEFQVIIKSRNLLVHYCQATSKAPKEYHRDICRDTKFHLKDALHLLRQANKINLYDDKRLKVQQDAYEHLERANDLFPALKKLGPEVLSNKSCSALSLELQSVLNTIDGWISSDRSRIKETLRRRRKNAGFEYARAKERYEKILLYYKMLPEDERQKGDLDLVRCYDEAYAEMEIFKKEYMAANNMYLEELENIRKRNLRKQATMHEKLYVETPPMAIEKIIDKMKDDGESEKDVFAAICKKRLYEDKDKHKKYLQELNAKNDAKEEAFRRRTLEKYGIEYKETTK